MKQIIFPEKNKAVLMERELKPMKPNQVRVRTETTAISSGTERANITGDDTVSPFRPPCVKWPRSAGYSAAGIITEVGEEVTDLKVGERVAMFWSHHRDVQNMNAARVIPIGDIDPMEACLWHIATFPLAAIRKCHLEIGESAIVMGQGILGQMAVKLLKAAGAAPVIAVDPVPEKRERAMVLGADYALDPFASDFAEKAKELTNGGANVAIEVTGNGPALNGVLDCMAKFGRVALLGCTRSSDFTVDYYRKVHGPGITLVGAHTSARPENESAHGMWTTRDDMLAIKKLYCHRRLTFADMVEEIHSPVEAPDVYDRLVHEKAFPVVVFDWRKMG